MRTRKKTPHLDSVEWDFRQIEDRDLKDATIWEYARTCLKVRTIMVEWLNSLLSGLPVRQHIFRRVKNPKKYPTLFSIVCANDGKFPKIEGDPNWELMSLVNRRGDFPVQWTTGKIKQQDLPEYHQSPVFGIYPFSTEREIFDEIRRGTTLKRTIDIFFKREDTYSMVINWDGEGGKNLKIDCLISEFSKWVRNEAKKHPRILGQPSQAQTYPLKCLSAYRLKQAGFTFSHAQEFLRQNKISDGGRLIPTYADPAGWTDAIHYAKTRLQKLASSAD